MNQTSSVATGAALATGSAIYPLIDWIINAKLALDAPQPVISIIAAAVVAGLHFAVNKYNSAKNVSGDAAP